MAGDWIKMSHALRTAPEVVRIMSALQADKMRTIGALYVLWCIADMHASEKGALPDYTVEAMDAEIGWPGFTQAVVDAEWLDIVPKGLQLPHFDRHNGRPAKRRAMEAMRKKGVRKMSASKADASSLLLSTVSPSGLGDARGKGASISAGDIVRIYQAYPRKIGKKAALPKIRDALKTVAARGQDKPVEWLLSRVEAFAASDQAKDLTYCLYPERWFRDGRYDDDDSAWRSQPGTGPARGNANVSSHRTAINERRAADRRREHPEPNAPIPTTLPGCGPDE